MKITVIIPTYNVEKYIGQCLESVVNQTYKNLEILVIDDVSSDNTISMVESLAMKDPRISLLKNDKNSGPSKTRNKGIKAATGDFIAFLDSDDWWDKNRLLRMIEKIDSYKADMMCDDQYLIDDNAEKPWGTLFNNGGLVVENDMLFTAEDFINKNMGLKPLIRTSLLRENDIYFNENIRYGEDYLLFLDTLLHGAKAYLTPEAYYFYRAREGSLVTNNIRLLEQTLSTTEDLLEKNFYIKNPAVKNALENRRKQIISSLKYYKFMQPIKDRKYKEGFYQLIKSPGVLLILAERTPKIFKNRVGRKFFKSKVEK